MRRWLRHWKIPDCSGSRDNCFRFDSPSLEMTLNYQPENKQMTELTRLSLSQTARTVDVFAHWRREGYMDLNPPYQRGDVWGQIRQRNLIRSILIGVPIPSIIVNDRFAANWGNEIAVIDGKQRITAILQFMDGRLLVPAEWFGLDVGMVAFPDLELRRQRGFRNIPIPVCEGHLESLEAEREVFELVNFGGVPQGMTD